MNDGEVHEEIQGDVETHKEDDTVLLLPMGVVEANEVDGDVQDAGCGLGSHGGLSDVGV